MCGSLGVRVRFIAIREGLVYIIFSVFNVFSVYNAFCVCNACRVWGNARENAGLIEFIYIFIFLFIFIFKFTFSNGYNMWYHLHICLF